MAASDNILTIIKREFEKTRKPVTLSVLYQIARRKPSMTTKRIRETLVYLHKTGKIEVVDGNILPGWAGQKEEIRAKAPLKLFKGGNNEKTA